MGVLETGEKRSENVRDSVNLVLEFRVSMRSHLLLFVFLSTLYLNVFIKIDVYKNTLSLTLFGQHHTANSLGSTEKEFFYVTHDFEVESS